MREEAQQSTKECKREENVNPALFLPNWEAVRA